MAKYTYEPARAQIETIRYDGTNMDEIEREFGDPMMGLIRKVSIEPGDYACRGWSSWFIKSESQFQYEYQRVFQS